MAENKSIEDQRSYFVAKSNDIIQRSRFSMSTQQQKIMMYLISKIKPGDDGSEHYPLSVGEFCRVCNIDHDSGTNYAEVKAAIKEIADKSVWFKRPDGKEILLRWIDRVIIDKNDNVMDISFHRDMLPFLLDLKERYTQYSLENILPMKSKYGLRLYELLKSYEYSGGKITIAIDELKKRMDCQNYTQNPDFIRRALDVAVDDINYCSDLAVEYTARKTNGSRAYTQIEFSIHKPDDVEWALRHSRKRRALGRKKG
jgi:plasmid replication initiation protein